MPNSSFDDTDLAQLEAKGLSLKEIQRQLFLFQTVSHHVDLVRPCTVGDGIERLEGKKSLERLASIHDRIAKEGRVSKFVPASGAATRMFRELHQYFLTEPSERPSRDELARQAEEGNAAAVELVRFLEGIDSFAFREELAGHLESLGEDPADLGASNGYAEILKGLLSQGGMRYSETPKGLIPFHRYEDGTRTAFEEHLVESAAYATDGYGHSRVHFTVASDHLEAFGDRLREVGKSYAARHGVMFEVTFSVQKGSTDTLAVDLDNHPFRTRRGGLLFRPGGHGALLENLNDIGGDIVFIKNIDNVQPDRVKESVHLWKRALGGHLVSLQERTFEYLRKLRVDDFDDDVVAEALAFSEETLHILPPERKAPASILDRRDYLLERLNRPMRVCGVVRNTGEPGGGPFWVRDRRGEVSLQIVESAQVDSDSEEQRQILSSSTHFNPVDLVCGLRDVDGSQFDLHRFVDQDAVIVTRKSAGGRDLKALERPGLWNGAMAGWTTVFVEVPMETFSPVKTVNDLLRPEHQ